MTRGAPRAEGLGHLGLRGAPALARCRCSARAAGTRACSCCTRASPGAHEFVERMRARDVPTEAWRMRCGPRSARVRAARFDGGPTIVHTHLVHADLHGLPAGGAARVPVRVSTKHGFNEFRAQPRRRASPTVPRRVSRTAQIAISHGLADYLDADRGVRRRHVHRRALRDRAGPPSRRRRPLDAAPRRDRRLIPIKGFDVLLRAFAVARRERSGADARDRGRRPARARRCARRARRRHASSVACRRSRRCSSGTRSSSCRRAAKASAWSRSRPPSAAARRSSPTSAACPRSSPTARPASSCRPTTPTRSPPRSSRSRATPSACDELGAAARAARRRISSRRRAAVDGVERVYRALLQSRSTAAAASSTSRKSNGTR